VTDVVWHDGQLVPPERATLPMASIALRYGVSVFEGVRGYVRGSGRPVPWLLEPHLERLAGSCALVGLDLPAGIPAAVQELLAAGGDLGDCYLRIAVSAADPGGIDAESRSVLTVSAAPMGRKRWLATGTGLRLTVGNHQRVPDAAFPTAAKCIAAYAGPRLALRAAKAAGWDNCLLVTADGLVSEAPTATVFLLEGDRLVTPRLVDAVLPGVTRAWVLATAAALGLAAAAEPVPPERVRAATEVFLCGTGVEFGPVREVDGVALGPHPVTDRLIAEHFAQARGDRPPTGFRWGDADAPAPVGRPG